MKKNTKIPMNFEIPKILEKKISNCSNFLIYFIVLSGE